MWIIFGNKEATERIPGGRQVERRCDSCGEVAMFYERRAVSKLQLYFIDVLEYAERRVMACGACGTLYATDELGAPDAQARGGVDGALAKARDAVGRLGEAARVGLDRVREAGERAFEGDTREPPPEPYAERPATDDPLADDDAAMEAKFRELEKKYRVSDD